MKKFIVLTISLLLLSIHGLNAQEDPTSKPAYRFFNEYGLFAGRASFGIAGIFVNGVEIDQTHFVGIGTGYDVGLLEGQGIPLFLNYRYFFDKGYKIKPFMNMALGTRWASWKEYQVFRDEDGHYYTEPFCRYKREGLGIYSTFGVGFTLKAFSFTTSIYYRARPEVKVSPDQVIDGMRHCTGMEIKVGFSL
ncbi:MAG: hypothetical protein PHR19_00540 [Bacteroidales bacterium]|jgi:hypothetical protein|nr:hypothetical protein [Bacteroidales bacterium]HHT52031.1 hypothetical protein [Bacteroidales bacterium]